MQTAFSNQQTLIIVVVSLIAIIAVIRLLQIQQKKKKLEQQLVEFRNALDHQKKMIRTSFEGHENDRKQLAKVLQDNIGMMLMTLRLNLNHQNENTVLELRQLVDETHDTIRKMTWDLMPTTIENFGLLQSTLELCDRLSSSDGPKITLTEHGSQIALDKDQELLLYRIAQEGIINAIKHAHATNINVQYQWNAHDLTLSIADDGLGFDFPTNNNKISGRHGLGLYNMENRVALLGGQLTFQKNNPTGTVVSVTLAHI